MTKYQRIIERVFLSKYKKGATEVVFDREDIPKAARRLGLSRPKNVGDVVYAFRYRAELPDSIKSKAPAGQEWIIRGRGGAKYAFVLVASARVVPDMLMAVTPILDSTPGIIEIYAFSDEQALLAKLRYNRLVDIFTGVTCYSLQNHLRTHVADIGQIETDEIYLGVDDEGTHYVLPIQAKGGDDALSVVQIEQDLALCRDKFPDCTVRPIGAQFTDDDRIVLFEFVEQKGAVAVQRQKHYRLVYEEDWDAVTGGQAP